jgi:hypothetical protein
MNIKHGPKIPGQVIAEAKEFTLKNQQDLKDARARGEIDSVLTRYILRNITPEQEISSSIARVVDKYGYSFHGTAVGCSAQSGGGAGFINLALKKLGDKK